MVERAKVEVDLSSLPVSIKPLVIGADIYESSCSQRANTYFIDRDDGYFLKVGPKDSLKHEANMTRYFHDKGFAAHLHVYENLDKDYMLTDRIDGEDATSDRYLIEPEKLSVVLGKCLRKLHDAESLGCPHTEITSSMLSLAHKNYKSNSYDVGIKMLKCVGIYTPEEGYDFIVHNEDRLIEDVHLHGDACLPNILLKDFTFSGFIDFEGGGIGDRHFDLLWTIWSLQHNLKTDQYRNRFLDAYGRDKFDIERFKLCGAIQAFTWED